MYGDQAMGLRDLENIRDALDKMFKDPDIKMPTSRCFYPRAFLAGSGTCGWICQGMCRGYSFPLGGR